VPARKRKKKHPIHECDRLFSLIIRSRGRCENCYRVPTRVVLQCAHGFPRRYRSVRWDERNAFCLCSGCHVFYTYRPLEWTDWMKARMGEELYEELRREALRTDYRADWPALQESLTRRFLEVAA
jgi:hypothetical protein